MRRAGATLGLAVALLAGCGAEPPEAPAPGRATAPNVLFVVWDTVRADHLSLYGYPRPTTPCLDAWAAEEALVFDDALATASSTVPTHASLFTGLLPSEHGAHAGHQRLDERFTTLGERFRDAGYRTYLWSANPHVSRATNFAQGFEVAEHPWSPDVRDEALRIVRAKVPPRDHSSALREKLARDHPGDWVLSAAGSLAAPRAAAFAAADPTRPWLVFLNYMEAHRPTVPPESYRKLFMSEAEVERSYAIDFSWPAVWAHVFGVRRYAEGDLRVLASTYDAALCELDDLFAGLLADFAARGLLGDETIVVLTADHGELLGEHGLLDHQYSLYRPLVRVPLVLSAPGRVEAGRTAAPVMAFDLYPTLLELAGIPAREGERSQAVDLLAARDDDRPRLAEYPAIFQRPLETVRRLSAGVDLSRWERRLRAFERGGLKLIEGEDGRHELYDLAADPAEEHDLSARDPETRERLRGELFALVAELRASGAGEDAAPQLGSEERRLLRELGYGEEPAAAPAPPAAGTAGSSWSRSE